MPLRSGQNRRCPILRTSGPHSGTTACPTNRRSRPIRRTRISGPGDMARLFGIGQRPGHTDPNNRINVLSVAWDRLQKQISIPNLQPTNGHKIPGVHSEPPPVLWIIRCTAKQADFGAGSGPYRDRHSGRDRSATIAVSICPNCEIQRAPFPRHKYTRVALLEPEAANMVRADEHRHPIRGHVSPCGACQNSGA